jgi:hypothetical protein
LGIIIDFRRWGRKSITGKVWAIGETPGIAEADAVRASGGKGEDGDLTRTSVSDEESDDSELSSDDSEGEAGATGFVIDCLLEASVFDKDTGSKATHATGVGVSAVSYSYDGSDSIVVIASSVWASWDGGVNEAPFASDSDDDSDSEAVFVWAGLSAGTGTRA